MPRGTPDFETTTAALMAPSNESWRIVVKYGDWLARQEKSITQFAMFRDFKNALTKYIPNWPEEIARPCPSSWSVDWIKIADHRVREIDTYGIYAANICGDKRLALSDGTQGVTLKRRIVAAVRSFQGNHVMKVGQGGEADLSGAITIEIGDFRIAVWVGIEVKMKKGGRRTIRRCMNSP